MDPLGTLDVVAIDCTDPEPLVEFWCAALGTSVRGREADWISLHPVVPNSPRLAFQVVPEAKAGKNRLHLDLKVEDVEHATARAVALGATAMGDIVAEDGGRFQVMHDPGGNEFCLCEIYGAAAS